MSMLFLPSTFRISALSLLLVLAGCSTYSTPGGQSAPIEKEPDYSSTTSPPTPAQPRPAPAEPSTAGAYAGLLSKADQASARGDYEQALALLERAQRIDPDAGEIYLSLAETYAAKGDTALAAATAERGLLYCSGKVQCDALRGYTR